MQASVSSPAPETSKPKKMTVWKALKGKERFASKPGPVGNKLPEKKTSKLFANNPEVPAVPKRAVQPIQVDVFSKKTFQDLNLHPFMVKTLETVMGMGNITAVQEELMPVLISGRDAMVRSQTGSGKTLAFAVPIVQCLQAIRPKLTRGDGVRALVIAPTRELALQIHEIFSALTKVSFFCGCGGLRLEFFLVVYLAGSWDYYRWGEEEGGKIAVEEGDHGVDVHAWQTFGSYSTHGLSFVG